MPGRSPRDSMLQMLDHAREAAALAAGKSPESLERERVLYLALIRLVEVIGEAANRVPQGEQDKYPEVQWRDVIGAKIGSSTATTTSTAPVYGGS